MSREGNNDLVPLDPEIERTFRARRREQQGLAQVEEMAEHGDNGQNLNPIPMDNRDRAMRDYATPMLEGLNPSIVRPNI